GDAALVAVHPGEDGAHAPVAAEGAEVVAAPGALDLDHVGSQVAQEHRAVRAGDDAREVEDADSLENASGPDRECPRFAHGASWSRKPSVIALTSGMPVRAIVLIRALASAGGRNGFAASRAAYSRTACSSPAPGTTRWTSPSAWASAAA